MSEISAISPPRGCRVLDLRTGEVKPPRCLSAKSGPDGYLTERILAIRQWSFLMRDLHKHEIFA